MLTYTSRRNLFASLANNSTDSATLTTADSLLPIYTRQVLTMKPWWFMEKQFTLTTVASTQFLPVPGQVGRILSSPYVTVGNTRYTPKESPSREHWDSLNLVTYSSDIPEWWFYTQGQIGLFPQPATGSYTLTLNAKQRVVDLSLADYSTGNITTTATAGSVTTVTMTGGTWAASMVGRYIKINSVASDTAAHSGDDTWYMIASVPSSTTLTLSNPYGGTALSGASCSYTIGQASILPEDYDHLPVWLALATYFTSIDPNADKANQYRADAAAIITLMNGEQSNRSGGRVLDHGIGNTSLINPNLTVRF